MRFIVGGNEYTINDLNPAMDKAFLDLHAAFLANHAYNFADFEKQAILYFGTIPSDWSRHDSFFQNFTLIWRRLLEGGHLHRAEDLWEMALRPALAYERKQQGTRIHKGFAYYFWGMTAILRGDIDKGYALVHQALEEDTRTHNSQSPRTPAFAVATLDYNNVENAFRNWVLKQADFLEELMAKYCSTRNSQLSLESFRDRFLLKLDNANAVFLFVYALARLMHLSAMPSYALRSSFVGQLELSLLFDLTLVTEAGIRAKNPRGKGFLEHAVFLAKKGNLQINSQQLRQVNEAFVNDLDSTLTMLLDGTFAVRGANPLSGKAHDLALTYGIRNHSAHNVSSAPTVWQRFTDIQECLFDTLFFCAEALY